MSKTETQENKETLESYKSKVQLQQTKIHYRYGIALTVFVTLAIGFITGYFVSINVLTDTQAKVVNSIQVSLKDQEK